jgi:hypothetical protein
MKRSKFSEEQIAYVLRQVEAGSPVGDVCRQIGVSEAWRRRGAGAWVPMLGGIDSLARRIVSLRTCCRNAKGKWWQTPTREQNAHAWRARLAQP